MTLRLTPTEVKTLRRIIRTWVPAEAKEFLDWLTNPWVSREEKTEALELVR